MNGMCGDRQPGGSGFLCTLPPGHGEPFHEARAMSGTVYAAWSRSMPRPQVRITPGVILAFIEAPDSDDDIAGPLRAAFEAAGLEVIE